MRQYSFVLTLLIGCSLLLASCGQNAESPSGFDILAAGEKVPVAAAQFVSLKERMHRGLSLQSAEELHVATLEAKDLQGNPFVYLNFAAPTPISDPYAFGLSLDGSEWTGNNNDSPWMMTITGAETNRDVHYMDAVGLELLMNLSKTVGALGGGANVKGLVAPTPTYILVEDQQGRYWDAVSGEVLTEEAVKRLREDYSRLTKQMNDPDYLAYLEAAWDCETDSDACDVDLDAQSLSADDELALQSAAAYHFALEDLTDAEGNLKVAAAAAELDAQMGSQLSVQGVWGGDMEKGRQAHFPSQAPEYFARDKNHFNDVHRCAYQTLNPYSDSDSRTVYIGCGPAAFLSLVWREWAGYDAGNGKGAEAGQPFYNLPFPSDTRSRSDIGLRGYIDPNTGKETNVPDPKRFYKAYYSFIVDGKITDDPISRLTQRTGDDQIAVHHLLHSCWFVNNPMTTGDDWRAGANRWLTEQHKLYNVARMRVVGNTSNGPGNPANKGAKHAMLIDRIKTQKKPIVALFPSANKLLGAYHISPVWKYDKSGRGIFATLHVNSLDYPDAFYNIGAYWVAETGLFYIEKY